MHVHFARRRHFGSRASFSVLEISFQSQLPFVMGVPADLVTPVSGNRSRRKTREENLLFPVMLDSSLRVAAPLADEKASCYGQGIPPSQ